MGNCHIAIQSSLQNERRPRAGLLDYMMIELSSTTRTVMTIIVVQSGLTRADPRRDSLGGPGSPGKSQKEGEEDQGEVEELGGIPLVLLRSSGPPGLPK